MEERETGVVKWFNDAKGFGFIERDQGGDVFARCDQIEADTLARLRQGQVVEFVVVRGAKGPQAADIRLPKAS